MRRPPHVHCTRHVCAAHIHVAGLSACVRTPSQVAGVGLADHAKLDSVGVLTLVSMFAINLPGAVSVECQGDITPDFQNVIDAIPSEQARSLATTHAFSSYHPSTPSPRSRHVP